jgi:hypothetical protein
MLIGQKYSFIENKINVFHMKSQIFKEILH